MAVVVTVTRNEFDAEIICGALRSHGIPCFYRKADAAAAMAGGAQLVGMAGPTEVLVNESDHDAALKIVNSD